MGAGSWARAGPARSTPGRPGAPGGGGVDTGRGQGPSTGVHGRLVHSQGELGHWQGPSTGVHGR